jgi:quinone-modifying oxidoreductase subunit QmoA
MSAEQARILVIGGGIAGMTAAIEAAEAGCETILVEKTASLGGRVARMNQYFPKLCPPSCGLEINVKRIRNNPRVTVLTGAEVEKVAGSPGNYEVTVLVSPRYVGNACTACGECEKVCPAERFDEFNFGLSKTKAAYLPHGIAYPPLYAIDRAACLSGCKACVQVCKYGAIDLDAQPERKTFRVSSIVAATGWAPYDAARLDHLGFGKFPNVVTNVMLERMAARDGPTGGKVLRPSDGAEPKTVAFVQCAGSRDENHLPYCSSVCCAASLKQTTYIRALYPDAGIKVFYIDVRTPGILEDFLGKVSADAKTELIKGKVALVEDAGNGDLQLTAEDVMGGKKRTWTVNLVVLATGIVPQTAYLPAGFKTDEFGFLENGQTGMYAAGCARRPEEVSATVRDATGAALKALQIAKRSAAHA